MRVAHCLALALALVVIAVGAPTLAHELRPAALSLVETTPGRFAFRFTPPSTDRGRPADVTPEFPEHCDFDGPVLDCGERGLTGTIQFPDLEHTLHRVSVRVDWLGGSRLLRTVTADRPELTVRGVPREARAAALLLVARDYIELGVEHILMGPDHLLFVFGLVILVGFNRRLIWTITAFTAAHSITLVTSSLEVASLPAAPVEAAIALSILLISVECAKKRASLTRRAPWFVAFAFGLLHGFGFAGALADVGLPPHQAPLALLFFNAGVELGQLMAIVCAWGLSRVVHRLWKEPAPLELALTYGIGTFAAFWTLDRASAIFAMPL